MRCIHEFMPLSPTVWVCQINRNLLAKFLWVIFHVRVYGGSIPHSHCLENGNVSVWKYAIQWIVCSRQLFVIIAYALSLQRSQVCVIQVVSIGNLCLSISVVPKLTRQAHAQPLVLLRCAIVGILSKAMRESQRIPKSVYNEVSSL